MVMVIRFYLLLRTHLAHVFCCLFSFGPCCVRLLFWGYCKCICENNGFGNADCETARLQGKQELKHTRE